MTTPKSKGGAAGGTGPARFIMIGGFLGAGKTTAVGKLAARLTAQGLRVGLITNDQGRNLVDTAMLRSQGFATEEIPGGCFCCRFDSLVEAAQRLTERSRPEVFIAEPVGSCTDLVATVTYPLRRLYGENFTVAPVSVLVDPIRALRVFGVEEGGSFSEKVLYIYNKQLEEADLVVISKCDLLDEARLESLAGRHRGEISAQGDPGGVTAGGHQSGGVVREDRQRRAGCGESDGGGLHGLCRRRGAAGLAELHGAACGGGGVRWEQLSAGAGERDAAAPASRQGARWRI